MPRRLRNVVIRTPPPRLLRLACLFASAPPHLAQPHHHHHHRHSSSPLGPAQHLRTHARARAPPTPVALALRAAARRRRRRGRHGRHRRNALRRKFGDDARVRDARPPHGGVSCAAPPRPPSPSPAADGGAGDSAFVSIPPIVFASDLAVGGRSLDVGRALDAADDTLPRVPSDPSRARMPTPIKEPATDNIGVRAPIGEVHVPSTKCAFPSTKHASPSTKHASPSTTRAPDELLVPITPEPLVPAPGGSRGVD
ncbi:hypothetical protein C8J57DRAFT_1526512 [Mycena rebaudengoi]|nr:hypothetical protein C8J57DRAFT_1526512 [Mycena rebaudengoi]